MFINIDHNKRKKGYKVHLAKPNKQKIARLSEAYGSVYSLKLGNINELSFNIPYFIDKEDHRIENENVELAKEKMYIEIEYNDNKEWMIIDEMEDFGDGKEKYLSITAFSNVYENSHKMIKSLELDSVNPEEYYGAILQDTSWKIGKIDPLFKDIYRSFDISNSTVLESILTGAETYGAVLDFDSDEKVINLLDMESRAKYRGLNINYKNFLQSVSRKSSSDEMTTRMYVYGADGMTITNVNPTGMPYIEDFSYFLYPFERDENKNVIRSSNYMSDELAHAIIDLGELNELHQPTIKNAQERIDAEIVDLIENETILSNLKFDLSTVKGLLDIAKATNDKELISQRNAELVVAQSAVDTQEQTVGLIRDSIEYHENEISRLQKLISVTSFSPKLIEELNPFIIEKDFSDDRYIDEKELYQDALENFEEARNPSYVVNASIDNIIDSLEEEYYSDKVVLGDIARIVDKDMRVDMKSLITEMTFSMDENSHDITISEGDIDVDGYDRILSILYNTQSTTTMLSNNKDKWDAVTEIRTEVDMMRDSSIDATKNRIYAGINESIEIGDRGIVLSNPDFPNEMVIMQAGVIALSKDGGETWNTSITPDGVVADTIIGKLVASNNLLITNDKGSFRVDSEGLTVDMDSIKIMSGEGDTPQNIVDSWNAILVTMGEFANDNLLNPYEKSQVKKQWDSIKLSHSSMVNVFIEGMGPETPENPYPLEYKNYMISYEKLNNYLNSEIQADGHTILDPNNMKETSEIDGVKYEKTINDYQVEKEKFQAVIPLEFSQTQINQLKDSISLNYVKNGDIISSLEVYEEGARINGKFLDITAQTNFNDDVVMNAGVIRSKDNGISIDLNTGMMNLSRPLTINYKPVATKEDLENIELTQGPEGKTAYDIAVENGFVGSESQWIQSLVGTKGKDGKTAYEVAVEEGFVGTKNDWLNSLKGPKGDTGPRGATGGQGPRGEDGTSVESIEEFYLATSESSNITTASKGWSSAIQIISPTNKYLWNYERITFSDGNKQNTIPVIIGTHGDKGVDGEEGRSILSIQEFYLATNIESGVTRDTSGWTTEMQKTTPDKRYLWNYEEVTWNKGTKKTFVEPIIIGVHGLKGETGPTGATGATGARGPQGAEGVGVESITEYYLVSSKNTGIKVSDQGWSEALQLMTPTNKYLWNYERVKFTDGTEDVTIPVVVGVHGDKGVDGTEGRSVVGITEYYLATNTESGVTRSTSGWTETMQKTSPTKRFLWNYEKVTWSSGEEFTYVEPIIIGVHGEKGDTGPRGAEGATGKQGPRGDAGTSVEKIVEYYLTSSSNSGITIGTQGWSTTFKPMNSTEKYLWNYEEIFFSDNTSDTTIPVIIGVYGDKGDEGNEGRGITNIEERYLASPKASGILRNDPLWTPEMQKTDGSKKYLWNYEIITWDKSPLKTYTEPIIIGVHGDKGEKGDTGARGATGAKGPEGAHGTSITGIVEYYALSNNAGTTPISWIKVEKASDMPVMTATNRYLWNKEEITFSDGNVQETLPVVIGTYGDKGDSGSTGATGRSITKVEDFYLATTASSGVTRSTSGWTSGVQPTSSSVRYLWNYEKVTWSSSPTVTYVEPIIIGIHGDTGPKGSQGDKGDTGTGVKSTIIHYAIHSNGTTAPITGWQTGVPSPQKGKYMWTRTTIEYTDNTNSVTYSVAYQATDGQKGTDGKGIASTTVTYAQTSSGSTTPTSWISTRPSPIQGQYLWSKTEIKYTDGTTSVSYSTSYSATDGQKGDKGDTGARGPQGTQGPKGLDGQSQYTHIRYSANANGSSMTTSPSSTTKYIGIAVTSSSGAPGYTGFTWSKYAGDDGARGPQGVAGTKGTDGKTTYTWIKYADDDKGSGMNDYPENKKYIGMAFNKTTPTESTTASLYTWSLMPQNIEFGGRNLLLNSGERVENNTYNIATYDFAEGQAPKEGELVTVTIRGELGSDRTGFGIYNSGGSVSMGQLKKVGDNKYSLTGPWKVGASTNENVTVYQFVSANTSSSIIENIKLERGDVISDWSEAPEDTDARIGEKADIDDMNDLSGQLNQKIDEEVADLATAEEVTKNKAEYQAGLKAEKQKTDATEQRLSDLLSLSDKDSAIVQLLGNHTRVTEFVDTSIIESDAGIFVGKGVSDAKEDTGILIEPEKISLISKGKVIAYITGERMIIDSGVFMESIHVGGHRQRTLTNSDKSVFEWVGRAEIN